MKSFTRAIICSLCLLCATTSLRAQTGSIRGVVRDSGGRPMGDVEVLLTPGTRRARADSLGRFGFDAVESGQYVLRSRRLGYFPAEWSVDLSRGGHAEVQLTLTQRALSLDTVYAMANAPCARDKYEGFLCRQAKAQGIFIDFTDIDTMEVDYTADLLRDVGGFGTAMGMARRGPTRIASSKTCTIVLLNGVAASWNSIPDAPYMITGIEIYKDPKAIPREFLRYTWGKEHCWLVAFWSYDFTMKPVRKLGFPHQRWATDPSPRSRR